MIIQSLKNFDQRTASGILAGLALGKSKNPGVGVAAAFSRGFDARELQVLSEIRQYLKIPADDNSDDVDAKISDVLSRAMSELLLQGKDRKAISARAGNSGRLPPSMYRVQLVPGFMQHFKQFGVREAHVRDTITASDDYQHLMTDEVEKDTDLFSVFLKWHGDKVDKYNYWTIAATYRQGDVLIVQHFWRVYPDVVDLSGAIKPVDFLAAFCNKYGHEIEFGDITAKFILQRRLPKQPGSKSTFSWKIKPFDSRIISLSPDALITTASVRNDAEKPFADVGILYSIDVKMYRDSLAQHGVILL